MVGEGVIDVTAVDCEILDLEFEFHPQRKVTFVHILSGRYLANEKE